MWKGHLLIWCDYSAFSPTRGNLLKDLWALGHWKLSWTTLQRSLCHHLFSLKLTCYKTNQANGNHLYSLPSLRGMKLPHKEQSGASLVAQWLRICLPMQGTRVRSLIREDPTCRGATKPVRHNYWACASGACAPQQEAAIVRGPHTAMKSGPHLPQLEKALTQKRRPNTAKTN